MSNRIIGQNGDTPSTPPASMDDLLNRAHNAVKFKRRDESIELMIAGMRLLSQGMAHALRELEAIKSGKNPDEAN